MIDLSQYAFEALRKEDEFILYRGRSKDKGSQVLVLAPLAEIGPEVRHPVLGKTIHELLLALPNTGENKSDCVRMMQRYP